MPDLPRGTVTFLFTDIAGSTKRWKKCCDHCRGRSRRGCGAGVWGSGDAAGDDRLTPLTLLEQTDHDQMFTAARTAKS
jgi:hypothetical protein